MGNHLEDETQAKGLIFEDFIYTDNILILLHGRVISLFDLQEKDKSNNHHIVHPLALEKKENEEVFYEFDHEPVGIWVSDKEVSNID